MVSADDPYPGKEGPQAACVSQRQLDPGEFVIGSPSPASHQEAGWVSPQCVGFWQAVHSQHTKDWGGNTVGSETMLVGVASDFEARPLAFTPTMTPNGDDLDNTGSRQ